MHFLRETLFSQTSFTPVLIHSILLWPSINKSDAIACLADAESLPVTPLWTWSCNWQFKMNNRFADCLCAAQRPQKYALNDDSKISVYILVAKRRRCSVFWNLIANTWYEGNRLIESNVVALYESSKYWRHSRTVFWEWRTTAPIWRYGVPWRRGKWVIMKPHVHFDFTIC